MNLVDFGWDDSLEQQFQPHRAAGLVPARVAEEHRHSYLVWSAAGELLAEVAGRLRHHTGSRSDLPAVGDWVALRAQHGSGTIQAVLPRRSRFLRKLAGSTTEPQVVAANIDTVLLISGLDHDYNPRRIERYLAAAWESGALPVVVLNKADLCAEVAERTAQVQAIAPGITVCAVSAATGEGLAALSPYLAPGRTLAALGSSGVGKSTLVNALAGAHLQATTPVRGGDSHGRHTTTVRQLIRLPGGAMVIDTPGMRELALWEEPSTSAFDDLEQLMARCRFSDCRHRAEPGCAVREAIERGALDPARLESYEKLQREMRHLERRQEERGRIEEKKVGRQRAKWLKVHARRKWGGV